jgi:hypothetical protein
MTSSEVCFDLEQVLGEAYEVTKVCPDLGIVQCSSSPATSVCRWIRGGIFKLLRSLGIDSKESISLAYGAWRAGKITLFLLGS